MFTAPSKPICSVVVKNIAPSTEPPTQQQLIQLFVFCGNIISLSVYEDKDSGTDSLGAYITFETESSAKTALLLNTTKINERPVSVELAPPDFKVPAGAITEPQQPGPQPDAEKTIFGEFFDGIAAQAKAIDEEHNITQTVSVGFTTLSTNVNQTFSSIDSEYQISQNFKSFGTGISTAVEGVDKEYEISNKAQDVGTTVTTSVSNFMSTASVSAVSGLETAKTAIDQFVESPTVKEGVASVKNASTSLLNSLESLFSYPK